MSHFDKLNVAISSQSYYQLLRLALSRLTMKYSQTIGVIACLALTGICFLPWVNLPHLNLVLNGVNGKVNDQLHFGTQLKPHGFLVVSMIVAFISKKIWIKRVNIFTAAINLALAIKNYLVFTMCREGICPQKQAGIYLLVAIAILIQVMTFLPKMEK